MTNKDLAVIQEKIGYEFKEPYLLAQAFTRRSFAAENQNYEDNEKLEFVGDKVLDFIVVKKLAKEYSFVGRSLVQSMESIEKGEKGSASNLEEKSNFEFVYSESEMTEVKKQIVQTSFLARAIEGLGLEKYLVMGKGDVKMNVQNEPRVQEDLFEAIIGAITIDCGWNMAILEEVVEKMLNLTYYIKNGADGEMDYVSYLQGWHMKEYGKEPEYEYISFGTDGGFQCYLNLPGYVGADFEAIARSKKAATRIVAKRAYDFIKEKESVSEKIFKVIGDFDIDSAINKLQMLQDQKIISGLDYIFSERRPTENSNGNPTWSCRCVVDGVDAHVEYVDSKKTQAKKAAAYEMLSCIAEKRDFSGIFSAKRVTMMEI